MLFKFRRSTNPVKFDTMVTLGLFKKFVWGEKDLIWVTPNDISTYFKIANAKYFCANCFTVLTRKDVHMLNKITFCLPCKKTIEQSIEKYKDKQLALTS